MVNFLMCFYFIFFHIAFPLDKNNFDNINTDHQHRSHVLHDDGGRHHLQHHRRRQEEARRGHWNVAGQQQQ